MVNGGSIDGECSGGDGNDGDSVVILGCGPGYLDVDLLPPPPPPLPPLTDCVTDDSDCAGLAGVVCVCWCLAR